MIDYHSVTLSTVRDEIHVLKFMKNAEEDMDTLYFTRLDNQYNYFGDKYEIHPLYIERISPPNPKIQPYYKIDCGNKNILDHNIYCADDNELSDWIRSFLYKFKLIIVEER